MPPDQPAAPRGMQEQVSAISDLLTGSMPEKPEETQEAIPAEPVEEVTEQESLGESLGASEDEAGSEVTDEQDEGEEPDGESAQVEEIRTLTEFATAAGWDASDLYALSMRLDNGEEIPLGQLKDKLQTYARQETELAAQREQLAAEQQKLQEIAQQQFAGQQQLSQGVLNAQAEMQAVQAEYNGINWDELAQSDPGRAALLQQQIAARYAGAKQRYGEAMQAQNQQTQQYVRNALVQNDQQFLEAVPEWKDPKVVEREGPQIAAYMQQYFKPQELERIYDWRARVIGRKAWLWDQHQAKVAEATGKVRKAPKPVLRPGGGAPVTTTKAQERELNAKMQRAKTTGHRNDQVEAIDALLTSSQRR